MKERALLNKFVQCAAAAGMTLALMGGIGAPAAAVTDPAARVAQGERGDRLQNLYQREKKVLASLVDRLAKADAVAAKTRSYIDEQAGLGKDVTELEAALTAYTGHTNTARLEIGKAKTLLDAHAGFDATENVIDGKAALATVKDAGKAERAADLPLKRAALELAKSVRDFRRDIRPTPGPGATPTRKP